jgi:alpha,alpha-trehalose-phosphate synthase [UDP-forming]/trehalose-phosphatase
MPRALAHFIQEELAGKQLIVVSNREPYIHKRTGLSLKVEQPASGLTSAMDDVLKATGGTWVAWGSGNGDRDVVDIDNRVPVPVAKPAYTLKRVWIGVSEVENYYHGYSNQVLWPLCHITLDRVYFRKKFWEDYVKVNRSFSEAVLEEVEDQSLIWVHDFHLCLVPRFVREKKTDATLAHFWHIPWPNWSVFRVCPQAREILEGLLGNDLIGFQIPLFAKNFMDCVKECLDAEIDERRGTVTWRGRATTLKAFPISVDFEKFNAMASSQRVTAAMKEIRERYHLPETVGLGVDRLEYTKALIKRLQAIALFFERFEKLRGRFTFIQIAVPTRMKEPYISYKQAVEEFIAKINGKYAKGLWKPIVYIATKVEHKDLAAYYRLADVAVISSIYDGMNLVAKEYAASQIDEKGALILSELAGAADELDGAILVNPYDIEEFSTSIRAALVMPKEEKTRRMTALRKQVQENDIYKWIRDFLRELAGHRNRKQNPSFYFFDHELRFRADVGGREIFLFLDYDGTLAPIADSPDKAVVPHSTYCLVAKLAERVPVAIVSGRSVEDIQKRLAIEGAVYAGNHGAEIRSGDKTLVSGRSAQDRALLEEVLERLRRALDPFEGVLIEDKGVTASVHYRNVDLKHLADVAVLFRGIAGEYAKNFRVTSGKKVFEIRPVAAWHKGDAVVWIADNLGRDKTPVYIGDDVTDEDAFRTLKGRGLCVAVGGSAYADYYVRRQDEVDRLLERLVAMEGG